MFRVVFVCTGNRCRSPLAAASFARAAGDSVQVDSAGTLQAPGLAPPAPMLRAAESVGLDLSGHLSRHLSDVDLGSADLVVGMAFEHMAAAVVDGGADPKKTFTLTEILRLSTRPSNDESTIEAIVERANAARRPGVAPIGEDVPDPMGGPEAGYFEAATRIDEYCRLLASVLLPQSRRHFAP